MRKVEQNQVAQLGSSRDVITELLREGARKMLITALDAEVEEYLQQYAHVLDKQGHRLLVRNGYMPERTLITGLGPLSLQQPRIADRRPADERIRFSSAILPPYLRRTKNMEELVPWLYLKGISTGDFPEALAALLGPEAKGLSANTIQRLKAGWAQEYAAWNQRSLEGKRYVYLWVDGIYFHVRLEEETTCILVIMGATASGQKELLAVHDGMRESEQSWLEVLQDLKRRGMKNGPDLAIGDGSLGFWAAFPKVFQKCRKQRCWVHKTANVLNKLPRSLQTTAKRMLQGIWMAATRQEAEKAFEAFTATYEAKYPKAVECLRKDREVLLTFYDFPAEHWVHIRTTNPIESTFSTVRLRTEKTRGCGTRQATLMMVFKLVQSAARGWRKLNGLEKLADVIKGVHFVDGVAEPAA